MGLFLFYKFEYIYNDYRVIFWPIQIGEETVTTTEDTANTKSYASEIESFRSLAGDSDAKHLEDFINQINSGVEDGISPIVLSPDSDKSHRTVSFGVWFQFIHLYIYPSGPHWVGCGAVKNEKMFSFCEAWGWHMNFARFAIYYRATYGWTNLTIGLFLGWGLGSLLECRRISSWRKECVYMLQNHETKDKLNRLDLN